MPVCSGSECNEDHEGVCLEACALSLNGLCLDSVLYPAARFVDVTVLRFVSLSRIPFPGLPKETIFLVSSSALFCAAIPETSIADAVGDDGDTVESTFCDGFISNVGRFSALCAVS